MNYMELFGDDPLAKSEVDDQVVQMERRAPLAPPLEQQQSITSTLKEKAIDKGTEKALTEGSKFGMDKLTSMFAKPTMSSIASPLMKQGADAAMANAVAKNTVAGVGAGAMGALGTAIPYLGIGLLAGKAFGLFGEGGHVGPLASVKYKYGGGPVKEEIEMKYSM